jgi:hypothetical protein
MPTESPRMPGETYKSMLRRGESRGLRLQAGEVAWYPKPTKKFPYRAVAAGLIMLISAIVIAARSTV